MSVIPVISENQQCQCVQRDGQRPQWEHNFVEIAVVGLNCLVEVDY
jgi:hypothetical protein